MSSNLYVTLWLDFNFSNKLMNLHSFFIKFLDIVLLDLELFSYPVVESFITYILNRHNLEDHLILDL